MSLNIQVLASAVWRWRMNEVMDGWGEGTGRIDAASPYFFFLLLLSLLNGSTGFYSKE